MLKMYYILHSLYTSPPGVVCQRQRRLPGAVLRSGAECRCKAELIGGEASEKFTGVFSISYPIRNFKILGYQQNLNPEPLTKPPVA